MYILEPKWLTRQQKQLNKFLFDPCIRKSRGHAFSPCCQVTSCKDPCIIPRPYCDPYLPVTKLSPTKAFHVPTFRQLKWCNNKKGMIKSILSGQFFWYFTNPRFPWNKGISLHQLPFGVFGCVRSRWNLIRSDGKGTVLDSASTISSNALRKSCSWAFFLGCMQIFGPISVNAFWLVGLLPCFQISN